MRVFDVACLCFFFVCVFSPSGRSPKAVLAQGNPPCFYPGDGWSSGWHGNIDSVASMSMVRFVVAMVSERQQRHLVCDGGQGRTRM